MVFFLMILHFLYQSLFLRRFLDWSWYFYYLMIGHHLLELRCSHQLFLTNQLFTNFKSSLYVNYSNQIPPRLYYSDSSNQFIFYQLTFYFKPLFYYQKTQILKRKFLQEFRITIHCLDLLMDCDNLRVFTSLPYLHNY
jgi:hypothetical protein